MDFKVRLFFEIKLIFVIKVLLIHLEILFGSLKKIN